MKLRLYCIPYAGGSATVFYKFRRFIDKDIEICPIELAGRGRRIKEPLYENLDEAANDIYQYVKDKIDGTPFAIFGHSLGGLLSYIVSIKLQQENIKPEHLFISACRAPDFLNKGIALHTLPDEEFMHEILVMGGTDKTVFDNPELSKFFIKILKSDFRIIENFRYNGEGEKVKTDLTVFCGNEDKIPQSEIIAWQQFASSKFSSYIFSGDHFFINSVTDEICKVLNRELSDKF